MNHQKAQQIVAQIWHKYDTDNNGQLDRWECKKLFRDIA